MNLSTPDEKASFLACSLVTPVIAATMQCFKLLFFFSCARINSVARKPSITGMDMSMRIRWKEDGSAVYLSTATSPFSAHW